MKSLKETFKQHSDFTPELFLTTKIILCLTLPVQNVQMRIWLLQSKDISRVGPSYTQMHLVHWLTNFSKPLLFTQSCLTLCNPTDCSMPVFSVLHYLPEFAQTLSIELVIPSIILNSSPSPPAFNLSQHRVFSNELVLHIRWPKYQSFSFSMSFQRIFQG